MAYSSKLRFISLCGILALIGTFFAPTLPKSSYAQDPAPQKIESDDGRVNQDGTWHSQPAPVASGGSYLYNSGEAALSINFSGPSLEVIYVSGPTLGTLAIEVDGTVLRTVITTDGETHYGQSAKINYLTDEAHELKVYAQGGGTIAVDAFVVGTGGQSVTESSVAEVAHAVEPDARFPLCDPTLGLQRANLRHGGLVEGNGFADRPSLSNDGRYVAFDTDAGNMIPDDLNGHADVFVRDRQTCDTLRVSVASDGTPTNNGSGTPFISGDGRYVVFDSVASNLVAGDTNNVTDIFAHDRQTGQTTRVSVDSNGTQGNRAFVLNHVTDDGRFILFTTSTSFAAADTDTDQDFYIHDRNTGTTTLARLTITNGRTLFRPNVYGQLSDDGRYMAATAVFNCFPIACGEVYLLDRQTNITTPISTGCAGGGAIFPSTVCGAYGSVSAVISGDGRYVAFDSDASNIEGGPGASCTYNLLVGPNVFPCRQVYLYDRTTQETVRLTSAASGTWALLPDISADGRYLSYEVSDVAINQATSNDRIFHLDRVSGQTTEFGNGNDHNYNNAISPDGLTVAFSSGSSNLVAGDTNLVMDIFVTGITPPSPVPGDKLALFRTDTNTFGLLQTRENNPPPAAISTFTVTPDPDGQNGQWVMGDWDGDGDKTPGTYANGAFFFINEISPNPTWLSVWIGLIDRPPVAGRFNAGVNHDCVGAVDSGEFPPYGTAFALYFTCDLTDGTAPTLTFQWLSVVLPDAGGFSGTHQFAAGDFNNDGVDSIAIRRGEFIAFGNVPPTTLLSEFNLAQYWGVPANTGGDYGGFLAGDFDNTAGDSFGVHYQNGNFYYRNAVDWYPGPHSLQSVGQPIGTPVQATTWR